MKFIDDDPENMAEKVKMICKICGNEIEYKVEKRPGELPELIISCKTCGYEYSFGE